jgi:hypothetical protein
MMKKWIKALWNDRYFWQGIVIGLIVSMIFTSLLCSCSPLTVIMKPGSSVEMKDSSIVIYGPAVIKPERK